jgi:RNA polymerase sigma-70 factor (ECF subfamily)
VPSNGDNFESEPVDDAALAHACSTGDERAIKRFEELYFGGIDPALQKIGMAPAEVDDVKQLVRVSLFVGSGGKPPRVTEVVGQGSLRALVRVMAVRTALNLRRRDHRLVLDDGPLLDALVPAADPALALVSEHSRSHLRRAFEDAMARLPRRDRTILRMHLVQAQSIDDIGLAFRVHRATAARWLGRIRDVLERDLRRNLNRVAGSSAQDLDSMLRVAESRLELSFERVLASDVGPAGTR